jgi:hypothetical protein
LAALIPTRIVPSVRASRRSARAVAAALRRRLEAGAELRPAGRAARDPLRLLRLGYRPRHEIRLFDTTFYLARLRQNPDLRFFVAYLVRDAAGRPGRTIYPRLFYKDVSLVWRCASHVVRTPEGLWIGKGDVTEFRSGGERLVASAESTTDLPLEIQSALEELSRKAGRIPQDERAVDLVLRRAPADRIVAYRDFTEPRRRARAERRNLVNGGRPIARFRRRNDPTSLEIVPGYEPDFRRGVLEVAASRSRLYGGRLARFRIVSHNRRVQYLFFASPRQVWIAPAQATTTELSSYGVRTVDVVADERLFVPAYEYHFLDESVDPPVRVSQIPAGFAGPPSPVDPTRADASAWLEELPVVRAFRRALLGR